MRAIRAFIFLACACNTEKSYESLFISHLAFSFLFLDCETWVVPSQIDALTPSAEGFFQTGSVNDCSYT